MEFSSHRPGDRLPERGFSNTWRTNKTKNRPLGRLVKLTHCEILQNTFLHFFKSEVVLIQNTAGTFQVKIILGVFIPGKLNQGQANEVIALKSASLTVAQGEMLCVQGPSGSGKTTLLSIIGCIFSPTIGRATIGGKKISRLPDHFLTRYRRELIGFVFQNYNMIDHLTVLENITLPLIPPQEATISPAYFLPVFLH